jgi:hypothetical protein
LKERFQQQVGTDRAISRLHFGYARLARPEAFRHLELGQPEVLAAAPHAIGQRELHFHELALFG